MDTATAYTISASQRQQLRDLNNEHRHTQEALNHAQASIIRAQKLNEQNYHRKRKQILSNGHGDDD
jgi:hypothetical protein